MTAYVVDASVVTEYLVMGHYTPNAVAFFQQMTGVDQLIEPEFCLLECANVLWKHVRFQGMPVIQAESLLKDLRKLPLKRIPVKAILSASLQKPVPFTRHRAYHFTGWLCLTRPVTRAAAGTLREFR